MISSVPGASERISSLEQKKFHLLQAAVQRFMVNEVGLRRDFIRRALDPRRDIPKECGYPETITLQQYFDSWRRRDIARRIVNLYPSECWSLDPIIEETPENTITDFEAAWQDVVEEHNLYYYMQLVDELSGIGQFGILLLGIDDGRQLSDPIDGINPDGTITPTTTDRRLLYIKALDQTRVSVSEYEKNINSPRYGKPLRYAVKVLDLEESKLPTESMTVGVMDSVPFIKESNDPNATGLFGTNTIQVHWSRVIHVAEGGEIFHHPRQEVVFNRICDLEKLQGGSAEMFYRGAFPGYSFETNPEINETLGEDAIDALKGQLEDYANGFRRYLATAGLKVNSLSVQVADPTGHLAVQLQSIAITLDVPMRKLMGSEEGHLASTQDTGSWNRKIMTRNIRYAYPTICRETINRLVGMGVIPSPEKTKTRPNGKYKIIPSDINTYTDLQKAEVAQKRTDALARYMQSGSELVVPPKHFVTKILGFTLEEAEVILQDAVDLLELEDEGALIEKIGESSAPPTLQDPNQVGGTSKQQDNRLASKGKTGTKKPDSVP